MLRISKNKIVIYLSIIIWIFIESSNFTSYIIRKYRFNNKKPMINDKKYIKMTNNLNTYYKPLFIILLIKLIKKYTDILFQNKKYIKTHDMNGLTYYTKISDISNTSNTYNKKTLIFVHGIGFGLTTYINFIDILDRLEIRKKHDNIILIELPNISYGKYIEDFPKTSEIITSIKKHFVDFYWNNNSYDMIGHSYGTIIVSKLVSDVDISNKTNKIVLLDPICFPYSIDNIHNVFADLKINFDKNGSIKKNIYRLLKHYLIFNDIETQILAKRIVTIDDFIFPKSLLNNSTSVFIPENDIFINIEKTIEMLSNTNSFYVVWPNMNHSDILKTKNKKIITHFLENALF
jgi:hypothetical protein